MRGTRGKVAGDIDEAGARDMACRVLAIREHSCEELIGKLRKRGVPDELASKTVSALSSEGLVDDLRFAGSFVRSRISRTQGPLKIRAELMKRGIGADLIEQALSDHEEQWSDLALQWVRRRASAELNQKEKARLYRSGISRGFSHQHMMSAINRFEKSG